MSFAMIAPKPKAASVPHPANRPTPTHWSDRMRGSDETALDSESAITLACHLGGLFDDAETWDKLVIDLAHRGFSLRFEGDRLVLVNEQTGLSLCTCASLGRSFSTLTVRLGKPKVIADTGRVIARPVRN